MINKHLVLGLLASASALTLGAVPVSAQVMEQSQQFTQTVNSSVKLENGSATNIEATASGTQSGSQSQYLMVPNHATRQMRAQKVRQMAGKNLKGKYVKLPSNRVMKNSGYVNMSSAYVQNAADGQVWLGWGMRGGTCHVRYTENVSKVYTYATAASCDEGGVTIGGLQSGTNYRFEVSQDRNRYSLPVVITAR